MPEVGEDPEAERALLGAVLLGSKYAADEFMHLEISDFWEPRHETIAATLRGMVVHGTPIDCVTTRAELESRGKLKTIGSTSYLYQLIRDPIPASADYYAEMIRAATRVREAKLAAQTLTDTLGRENASAELDAILHNHRTRIDGIPGPLSMDDDDANDTLGVLLEEPDKVTDWLVPGLLSRQERVVMVAGEGVAKSTMLRQFAVCFAAGLNPWNGQRVTAGLRVLYVDAENSREQSKRAYRWIAGRCYRPTMAHGWRDRIIHKTRNDGVNLIGKDAGWFRDTAARVAPDVIILGPSYKLMRGDPKDDGDTLTLFDIIDRVRVQQDAAILIESHAPLGQFLSREMRPFGSARWLAWPEVGLGWQRDSAVPEHEQRKRPEALESVDWRGAREERDWPQQIVYGGPREMPWVPRDPDWAPSVDGVYDLEVSA